MKTSKQAKTRNYGPQQRLILATLAHKIGRCAVLRKLACEGLNAASLERLRSAGLVMRNAQALTPQGHREAHRLGLGV